MGEDIEKQNRWKWQVRFGQIVLDQRREINACYAGPGAYHSSYDGAWMMR